MNTLVTHSIEDLFRESEENRGPTYRCVLCLVALDRSTQRRAIPDYLCLTCFHRWSGEIQAPWMRKLQNMARGARLKRGRWRRHGAEATFVSLERLPLDTPHNSALARF